MAPKSHRVSRRKDTASRKVDLGLADPATLFKLWENCRAIGPVLFAKLLRAVQGRPEKRVGQESPTSLLMRLKAMDRGEQARITWYLSESIGRSTIREGLSKLRDGCEDLLPKAAKHLCDSADLLEELAKYDLAAADVVRLEGGAENAQPSKHRAELKLNKATMLRAWARSLESERSAIRVAFSMRRFGTPAGAGRKLANPEWLARLKSDFGFTNAELARLVEAAYWAWKHQSVDADPQALQRAISRLHGRNGKIL